jgi:hypothetical protein
MRTTAPDRPRGSVDPDNDQLTTYVQGPIDVHSALSSVFLHAHATPLIGRLYQRALTIGAYSGPIRRPTWPFVAKRFIGTAGRLASANGQPAEPLALGFYRGATE